MFASSQEESQEWVKTIKWKLVRFLFVFMQISILMFRAQLFKALLA